MTAITDCITRPPDYKALARENAQLRAELAQASELADFYVTLVAQLRAELNEAGEEVSKLYGELCGVRYLAETHRAARELAESRVSALITDRIGYTAFVEVPQVDPAPRDPVPRDPAPVIPDWLVELIEQTPVEQTPVDPAPVEQPCSWCGGDGYKSLMQPAFCGDCVQAMLRCEDEPRRDLYRPVTGLPPATEGC